MSRGGRAASAVTAAGVIGLGWWVGTHDQTATTAVAAQQPTTSAATSSAAASSTATSRTTTTSSAATSGAATSSAATSSAAGGTYTGSTESDRYGQLTVTVVESGGKIANITYKSTAGDGHSLQIENQAIPVLKSEAIAANSAKIDSVSGATYTSTKYKASLQSALDKA